MDEIDELVDYQLGKPQDPPRGQDMCPNCRIIPWHGKPSSNCWGSHLPREVSKRKVVGDMSLGYFTLPDFRGT